MFYFKVKQLGSVLLMQDNCESRVDVAWRKCKFEERIITGSQSKFCRVNFVKVVVEGEN